MGKTLPHPPTILTTSPIPDPTTASAFGLAAGLCGAGEGVETAQGQIERDLAEAVDTQKLMLKELEVADAAWREAQGALSQAGCSGIG